MLKTRTLSAGDAYYNWGTTGWRTLKISQKTAINKQLASKYDSLEAGRRLGEMFFRIISPMPKTKKFVKLVRVLMFAFGANHD